MKIFLSILLFLVHGAYCQKQIVLLKGERILLRLRPGDDFVYKLKGSSTIVRTYVNNLSDTAVVAHTTIIPFHRIDKLYFRQSKFSNRIGTAMVILGTGIFLIDQFNEVVVQGNSPTLDSRVSTISLSALAVGLPMMLIRKKSQRIRHPYRLLQVKEGSPFYLSDRKDYQLPDN